MGPVSHTALPDDGHAMVLFTLSQRLSVLSGHLTTPIVEIYSMCACVCVCAGLRVVCIVRIYFCTYSLH